jgi:hypothetical protein
LGGERPFIFTAIQPAAIVSMSGELVIWAGHAAVFILPDFLAGVCRKITRTSVSLCPGFGYVQKLGVLVFGVVQKWYIHKKRSCNKNCKTLFYMAPQHGLEPRT